MATKKQVKAGSAGFFNFRLEGLAAALHPLPWIGVVALLALTAPAGRGADPTAQELLQSVRLGQGAQHRVLNGQLRCEGRVTPFRLVLNGKEIRYEFTGPDQTFVLGLGEKSSRLDEITKEGRRVVTPARFRSPVRDTDITCEDLALQFLYWPDAKILREEDIDITRCYLIELHPEPGAGSQYARVLAWIGKKNSVLRQADCYDSNNKLVAHFKVKSAKQLDDGAWFLKQMTVERMKDGKSIRQEPSYLEILGEGGEIDQKKSFDAPETRR